MNSTNTIRINKFKHHAVVGLFVANLFFITWAWIINLHFRGLPSASTLVVAVSHILGLYSAFLILCLLLLMSRVWLLEQAFGMEKLTRLHRKVSYWAFYLLLAHFVLVTVGYELSAGVSFVSQFMIFIRTFEDVLKAVIGLILFIVVTVSSIVVARRKLRYEVWYAIHLLAYLAVLLAYKHQFSVGPDFIGRHWFVVYWYGLYFLTLGCLIWFRAVWQLLVFYIHRFQIAEIKKETHDTYSVVLKGRDLQDYHYEAGQFAIWHVLAPGLWWQSHPFSYSSIPNSNGVRFTAKLLGDYTTALSKVQPGTWVVVDGPFGKFTKEARQHEKLLFIAGGVGITPIYALICDMAGTSRDITLLYACRTKEDVAFRREIVWLQKRYKIKVYYFFSNEQPRRMIDESALRSLAPDARDRDVYICGPPPMMADLKTQLIDQGVPKKQIHTERFDY